MSESQCRRGMEVKAAISLRRNVFKCMECHDIAWLTVTKCIAVISMETVHAIPGLT